MKRRTTILFALVASFLVVSAVPVAVADTNLALGGEHDTASELSNGTLDGVKVEGSGESAYVTLKSSKTVDDFEDGSGTDEYGGDTSPYSATTSPTASGSYALHGSDGDSSFSPVISSTSGLPNYPSQGDNISVKMRAGQDAGFQGFQIGTQDETNTPGGYLIQLAYGDNQLKLFEEDGTGNYNNIASTSASLTSGEWYEVKIEWKTDGTVHVRVYDSSDNLIAEDSFTDSTYTSGGIGFRYDDGSAGDDYYYDDVKIDGRDQGTYTSPVYSVTDPEEGRVDLSTLTDANATVTWQADPDGDGNWNDVTTSTYTSTGVKTADLSSVSSDKWRVKVRFEKDGPSPETALDSDSIYFTNHDPEIDEGSASPQGNEDVGSADVELSVPISDAEFGSAQGDEVTVDFYVDGSLIDTQTITSNQTVSTVAQDLGPGNHTWHVETTDSYGGNATSSTWEFDVNHYAADLDNSSADPQGGQAFNDENVQVSIPVNDTDFGDDTGDEVTVDLYVDGEQTASTSITSNQTVAFNISDLGDGSHSWHVETSDSYGLNSSSSTFSFEVNHYAPAPNNAEAEPSDGTQKTTREVTFSVPVNDTDFAETSGDEVQATFYLDGEQFATKNITANGTVSASTTISDGGAHTWHVELVDEYGITNETDADPSTSTNEPFSFQAPSEMRIYNESAPNTLVDEVTVEIQFYGGADGDAFTVQRSTDNGVINMSGLPADQEFIVVVNSEGYHNRRIYVESLYEQANVFLLPESKQAVYNVFKIDDKSGAYPPGETRIIIQRALNRSGNFTWQTVSGDFFGSTNEHKTYLRYNVRYRLIVENDAGQRRMMGPYFATDENNPKIITVSSIVVSPPDGQAYYGTSYIEDENEDDGQKTLRFTYTDPDEKTDSLDIVIHERGNESNVLADVSTDDVGSSWTYSTVLDENESAKSWVVDWKGQRDGEEIGAMVPVGNRGGLPIPMAQEWLTRFGLIALVVVASLSSERMATIGAMGTVAFAGVLMITGIWEIPVVLWFAALIIAVGGHALTKAQRGGVVG